jgi:peptide chain release factor 3
VEAPTYLVANNSELRVAQEQWPSIEFHAMREHAGLVFQQNL